MGYSVRFNFVDSLGRTASRSFHNVNTVMATVLADVATIAPLIDAVSDGGLESVVISQRDIAAAFAAAANSNIDENASLEVLGSDAFRYDFDLPMPINALRLAGGAIDTANAALLSLIAQFQGANPWRINLRHPVLISSIIGGQLDK